MIEHVPSPVHTWHCRCDTSSHHVPPPCAPHHHPQKHKKAVKKAGLPLDNPAYPIHSAKSRPPKGLEPPEEEARRVPSHTVVVFFIPNLQGGLCRRFG